jgi:LysR family hydrogen peroxide-inducible transcriptional activator
LVSSLLIDKIDVLMSIFIQVFVMYLPNLKHLRYLVALHKHQHFHQAAAACFVSQSTLSSAILKLEEQLNCQLIERDNKSFLFTSQGNDFVEKARQLLVSAAELVNFAQQQTDPKSGVITIGCIPTIAPYLLTDLVTACQQHLPNLSLFLREDTTENLLQMLKNGDVDIVILALPVEQVGFKSKVVGKDVFYIAGHPRLVKQFQQQHDYKSLPEHSVFLLSKEHCLTEHAVSACQLADASRINHFSASSLSTLVQMTTYHQGFTFLPEMAVKKGLGKSEGLMTERLSDDVYREIGLMWRATSLRGILFDELAAILSKILR